MLNICDFGAAGDGATDNTASIQAALDQAAETQSTVFVPEGVFLTSMVRMSAQTGLMGNPAWTFRKPGGSVLKLNDPQAECLLELSKAHGATVNGISFDGDKLGENIPGIMVNNGGYGKYGEETTIRIERCRVDSFSGHGVMLQRIWCFSLRHNMISHNGGDGIWLQGWDGFILDNWLTGNLQAGLGAYEKTSAITVTSNRVEWNHGAGLDIRGGNHYNITGNYFDRQGGPGLDIRSTDNEAYQITAIGNSFNRNGKPARCNGGTESAQIRCMDARGIIISGNICESGQDDDNAVDTDAVSPDYGIVFGGLRESIIKDNTLSQGALKELLHDLGGHGEQLIVKDNVGSLTKI